MKAAWALATALCAVFVLALWPDSARGPHLAVGWVTTTGPGILAAATVLFAAWGAGTGALRRLHPSLLADEPVGRALMELALGLVVLQCGAVALGLSGLFTVWTARAVVLLGVGVGALSLRAPGLPRPGALQALLLAGAAVVLLPLLLQAGAPPTGADELQYHVRFVEHLLAAGSFAGHLDDPVSGFAQGLHALMGLVHALAGAGGLRPLALSLGLLGLLAGQRLTHRISGPTAAAAYVPIALGAASVVRFLPVVSTDVPLMLFVTLAVLLVVEQQAGRQPTDGRAALLLGVLGGAAFSIKYTAAPFLAPLWLAAVALGWRRDRPTAGWMAAAALIPLAFAAPWMLKNVLMDAHPLLPLAGYAPPEGTEAAFRFNLVENYGAGAGLGAWLRTPWDLFLLGNEFDRRHFLGRLSPWPLLAAPLLLLSLRHAGIRLLACVGVGGLMLWAGPLRRVVYLLPLWPVIAAATAATVAEAVRTVPVDRRAGPSLLLAVALGLTAAAEIAVPWADALDAAPVATGLESTEDWLAHAVESAATWDWVRENVPAGEVVTTAFLWRLLPSGHAQRWACAEECTLVRLELLKAGDGAGALRRLRAMGSRWMVVRQTEFVRERYAALTDAEFAQGYALPLRVLDELTTLHGTLRFSDGRYAVYEFPDQKTSSAP